MKRENSFEIDGREFHIPNCSTQIYLLYYLAINQRKVVAEMEKQGSLSHFEYALKKWLEGKP